METKDSPFFSRVVDLRVLDDLSKTTSDTSPALKMVNNDYLATSKAAAAKAKAFRQNEIFKIVNNFQKSMQILPMVQSIDETIDFLESVSAFIGGKKELQTQLLKVRSLLFSLDNLNSRQINAKLFRDS